MAPAHDCLSSRHQAATRRETLMSALALFFLLLNAFALHLLERHPGDLEQLGWLAWLFAANWLPILVEAIQGYWRSGEYSWSARRRLWLICLLPPYRLALSTYPAGRCFWLPVIGWQAADRECYERLDRLFSIPMLCMATLILPILAVEHLWSDEVERYPALALGLDLGTSLIWLAFAIEFIIMSAVAEKKWLYVARHWVNLLIILLPYLSFLRGLQLMRLVRLGKLTKALKIYRLRGLGMRAWQGIIALELVERVLFRSPEARLQRLREQVEEKELELLRLRRRVAELESQLGSTPAPVEADPIPGRVTARCPEEGSN